MDTLPNRDYYEAFVEYQSRLLAQFETLVDEYDFRRIDATRSIREVFQALTTEVEAVLSDMKPIPLEEAERELSEAIAEGKALAQD
jgi:dTMP kinase